jgi:ribonuclease HII
MIEAGCDEAGRGCLAGPVFAAAVILKKGETIDGLRDSKKLTKAKREDLRGIIMESAESWAVASCTVEEIDRWNILQASVKAMHRAIENLRTTPEHLLIDGNYFKPFSEIPYSTIVGGDDVYLSIAASSVLAKTYRDDFMVDLGLEYPEFGFERHKGYATPQHISAIEKFGYTDVHRKSFSLKKLQPHLF